MDDKILCPWCGAEMRMNVYNDCAFTGGRMLGQAWRAFYRCHLCGAQGPEEKRSAGNKAEEAARAATLRRYTPPIKPMPLEELEKRIAEFDIRDGDTYYVERKDSRDSWIAAMYIWYELFLHKDVKELYGKKWRCWERKPTDEERSAAEWEI